MQRLGSTPLGLARRIRAFASRAHTEPQPPLLTRVVTPGYWPASPQRRKITDDATGRPQHAAGWIARHETDRPPLLTRMVTPRPLPLAIQLKTTLRPIERVTLPDIDALRRFAVYTTDHVSQGLTWHRLRLGFFADSESARRVLPEVKLYFRDAQVVGVGTRERLDYARANFV